MAVPGTPGSNGDYAQTTGGFARVAAGSGFLNTGSGLPEAAGLVYETSAAGDGAL